MLEGQAIEPTGPRQEPLTNGQTLAPAWHTVVLIAGILSVSIIGRAQMVAQHHAAHRLLTYATTAGMELLMLGWVALGLRLRRIPLASLFGTVHKGMRGVFADLGIAFAFWIGSLMILGTLGLVWTSVEVAVSQWSALKAGGHAVPFSPNREESVRAIEQLAPADGAEIACWVLLCCLAGTIEEAVFRGYLQHQFTAWTKGGMLWGVVFSSLLFGAAHGYQGVRNMVLLAVFGALFSVLAILRGSLRAGIFAHSWHDMIAGLVLTFLRSRHLL
jgi:membrane protease YdiL (CAAX protease family)